MARRLTERLMSEERGDAPLSLAELGRMFDPPFTRQNIHYWTTKGLRSLSGRVVKLKTARGSTGGRTTTVAWFWDFMGELND